MYVLNKYKEIVIWGCGQRGKEFIEKHRNVLNIRYCVDSKVNLDNQTETHFLGYRVFNPNVLHNRNVMIIIAMEKWQEAAKELINHGYKLFKDFLPYTYVDIVDKISALDMGFLKFVNSESDRERLIKEFANGRHICAVYGLCHMRIYKRILEENKEFKQRYMLLDLPPINATDDENYSSLKEEVVWRNSDVVICGLLDKSLKAHGDFPSTSELLKFVKSDCKIIKISGAAFKGFFPQHAENRNIREDENGIPVKKYFAWGDKNINRLFSQGKNPDEIKEIILSEDFYDRQICIKFFQNELALLEKEEANCDVKIADYIKEIAQNKITHFSFTHPIPEIMVELSRRLLLTFGIHTDLEKYKSESFLKLDANEEIVYPSVLKAHGLNNKQNIERQVKPGHILFDGEKLSSEEYVEKYIEFVCKV